MNEQGSAGKIAGTVAALLLAVVVIAGAAGAAATSLLTTTGEGVLPALLPGLSGLLGDIPAAMLNLYQDASAQVCPGMSWTVLAAVGTVESDNDTSNLPGVHSGANPAGAEGPMQMLPATFNAYALPTPAGGTSPPSPYDPADAVYAAARGLCANGAGTPSGIDDALYAYNHSSAYVNQVVTLAASYTHDQTQQVITDATSGGIAVDWALAQVGTPYTWGGETPGVGFDCSGLVQAAYHAATINLPRTAQAQYDAGPLLPAGVPLLSGDLVFFGAGPADVSHVGIVVANGEMVDAPHTGAAVRVEFFPPALGALWGSDELVGFTRPAG